MIYPDSIQGLQGSYLRKVSQMQLLKFKEIMIKISTNITKILSQISREEKKGNIGHNVSQPNWQK